MIITFADRETETIFRGYRSSKLPNDIQERARRKLLMIHAATAIQDLCVPPGNHLEKLDNPNLPEWSIRINDQWRVVFNYRDANAYQVQIIDYH